MRKKLRQARKSNRGPVDPPTDTNLARCSDLRFSPPPSPTPPLLRLVFQPAGILAVLVTIDSSLCRRLRPVQQQVAITRELGEQVSLPHATDDGNNDVPAHHTTEKLVWQCGEHTVKLESVLSR